MKTSMFKVLTTTASVLALSATAVACGPGGGGGGNRSTYPSQYSTVRSTPVVASRPAVASTVAPTPTPAAVPTVAAAPQARLTVVSSEPEVPKANLQLAPATPTETAVAKVTPAPVKETTPVEPKTDEVVTKALDSTAAVTTEPSKIADALKGLVGTWLAVARQGQGELSTVELQLDDSGWAKLTVPGSDGKPSTTTRKVEFENEELKLTGSGADVTLGKLVDFDSRQMVLERSGSQVTFVRP